MYSKMFNVALNGRLSLILCRDSIGSQEYATTTIMSCGWVSIPSLSYVDRLGFVSCPRAARLVDTFYHRAGRSILENQSLLFNIMMR